MNIIDAAHKTVHDYPGGSESLGPRIGMSPAVLRNKVNPNNTTHHLTLAEASEVMGLTGDHRILHALAAEHGYTLQSVNAPSAGSIMAAMLAAAAAKGDLAGVLAEALADNRITPNEASDIARCCAAVQAAVAKVSQHANAQAGASA